MDNETFLKKQAELDLEMSKIWVNPFFDGITNFEKYQNAKIKILWILKEVNDRDNRNHDRRHFHAIVEKERTFYNVMCVSYAILHGMTAYDESELKISNETLIKNDVVLDEIAIINVNKSEGGTEHTPHGRLDEMYNKDLRKKDFLFEQINFINPEIIINAHHCDSFIRDQLKGNKLKKSHDCNYAIIDNRIIIDTYHPLNIGTGLDTEAYCNSIIKTVSENLQK
jgi:hypothetical protein